MSTLQDTGQMQRRHKGQTLAEFAITLPILLTLTFGIVEFGRVFQAWVTLQNSARAAARYASTGQYYEDVFVFHKADYTNIPTSLSDPDSIIPCVDDGTDAPDNVPRGYSAADQRGTLEDYYPNHPLDPKDKITIYNRGVESLFATWYAGDNCDPRSPDDLDRRKDMARLFSIVQEARKGASGLALEDNSWVFPTTNKDDITNWPWFNVWKVPNPRETQRSWFDVVVCSNRRVPVLKDAPPIETHYMRAGGTQDISSYFVTYLDNQNLRVTHTGHPSHNDTLNTTTDPHLPQAGCLLNMIPPSTANGKLDNAGKPWLDPGGPGDTVTVIVTFNHPLITPLPLPVRYIKMQARRSAIVESFRAANAPSNSGEVPSVIDPVLIPDDPEPSLTPSITPTPSSTSTPTPRPSSTPTNTQTPPFSCNLITAKAVPNGTSDGIFGNTISIDIKNANSQATFITRVIFKWPTILDYPGMYEAEMALDGSPHWQGMDKSDINSATNTTDTNTDGSIPPNFFVNTQESDRTVAANDTGNWTALLGNGPALLQQYVSIYNFAGTTFYMSNPLTPGTPCVIPLTLPPPTNTPVFNPNNPTNTPTFTPDCASSQVSVRWVGFEQFGIVRLEVVNNRNVVAGLTDFSIMWNQRLPGILTLDRVSAVAPYGQPGSIEIWHASSATQDATPPTGGHTEGVWVQNFTFPPQSITPLLIDFGGVPGLLSASNIGMTPSDFNGTQFRIGCGGPGGNGSGSGGTSGLINLANAPTPAPTNTPGPSNTPKPTTPPTKTYTPGPPTATNTVGPTPTPRPTNTPKPPPTATTPPPPPTLPGGGCGDGC